MSESRTKQRTRNQIQTAFVHLLVEKGLQKISVAAITKAANINRSTFYEYYPDVRSLLEDVENNLLAKLNTGIHAICGEFTEGKPEQIFETGLDIMQASGDTLVLLLGVNGDPAFAAKFIAMVKPQIISAFHLKEFTPQMDTAVTFAMSGLIGVFTSWYADGKREPLERVIQSTQELLSVILQGTFC
ncbi:MAG: TetR/AcrR family transcriptional regulator [Clostridiales bacterium]|nr:TetR/AcrR family transcriptional regulator [Clostridiales bacterium]